MKAMIIQNPGSSSIFTFTVMPTPQVFFTAGSDEKIQKCLSIGGDIGINYKNILLIAF